MTTSTITYHVVTELLNRKDPAWVAGIRSYTGIAHKSPKTAIKAFCALRGLNVRVVAKDANGYRPLTEDEEFDGWTSYYTSQNKKV